MGSLPGQSEHLSNDCAETTVRAKLCFLTHPEARPVLNLQLTSPPVFDYQGLIRIELTPEQVAGMVIEGVKGMVRRGRE